MLGAIIPAWCNGFPPNLGKRVAAELARWPFVCPCPTCWKNGWGFYPDGGLLYEEADGTPRTKPPWHEVEVKP